MARAEQIPDLKSKLEARKKEQEELPNPSSAASNLSQLEPLDLRRRNNAREKLALLEEAAGQLKDAFHALSADALKSKNQAFLEWHGPPWKSINRKLASDLENRQKAVEGLVALSGRPRKNSQTDRRRWKSSRQEAYGRLTRRSIALASQQQLQQETGNRGQGLARPTFEGVGGIHLAACGGSGGMSQYCDFEEHSSVQTESGKLRPDMRSACQPEKLWSSIPKSRCTLYLEALKLRGKSKKEGGPLQSACPAHSNPSPETEQQILLETIRTHA